jgi:hypothetical protein
MFYSDLNRGVEKVNGNYGTKAIFHIALYGIPLIYGTYLAYMAHFLHPHAFPRAVKKVKSSSIGYREMVSRLEKEIDHEGDRYSESIPRLHGSRGVHNAPPRHPLAGCP